MNITFAIPRRTADDVFSPHDQERLRGLGVIIQTPRETFSWEDHPKILEETDILITGWHTPDLEPSRLSSLPRLSLVANASGGVRGHLPPELWQRGVRVVTASSALGWGVAEFALACIILASKRAFWLAQDTKMQNQWREETNCFGGGFELFQCDIGIVGVGQSARTLMRMLAPFSVRLWAYDPFLTREEISALGAQKVESLDELFAQCRVVSLHAALNDATRNLLRGRHFERLQPGAVFINTARASIIHEAEFISALEKERFVACIDVTQDEPPAADHPFRHLPNVVLTPHIAGAIHQNRFRMGALVIDEIERFLDGLPLQHEVMLNTLTAIA